MDQSLAVFSVSSTSWSCHAISNSPLLELKVTALNLNVRLTYRNRSSILETWTCWSTSILPRSSRIRMAIQESIGSQLFGTSRLTSLGPILSLAGFSPSSCKMRSHSSNMVRKKSLSTMRLNTVHHDLALGRSFQARRTQIQATSFLPSISNSILTYRSRSVKPTVHLNGLATSEVFSMLYTSLGLS